MSTEVLAPLPIPEQVIVGTGTYVIPADRYGFLSMSTASSSAAYAYDNQFGANSNSSHGSSSSGSSNSNHQWVKEGDTITTTNSSPTGTTTTTTQAAVTREATGEAVVRLNGSTACISRSSAGGAVGSGPNTLAKSSRVLFSSTSGWSVSLFRIPKANLPTGTAEGE